MSSVLGGLGLGGGAIGKAIVQLELDSKKYAAEMQAAETQTKTSTSKLGSSFSAFGGLAKAALLGIGAAAVVGLGASVKAAIEANEAQARLHNTIKNAPQLSASAEQAFLDQAEAIRQVTGADDEAIISGQALLGNMGLQQDQITDLAPLVVDLATKYNIDLQSAFKAVGKAATGSTGTLARYVGQIEAGATPAETFQNVLTKLGGAAGFAAEQAKSEPWKLLQSDLEELSETVGQALIPVLRKMADVLGVLLDNLQPIIIALAGFAAFVYLPPLLLSIAVALEAIGAASIANGIFNVAAAMTSLGTGVAALAAVDLAGVAYLINKIATGADPTFVNELSDAVVDIAPKLKGFSEGLNKVGTKGQEARQKIVNFAHMTTKELKEWEQDTEDSFNDYIFDLNSISSETEVTRKDFREAFRAMKEHARDFSQAMRTLKDEDWVNEKFVQFLSDQGPEWIITFTGLNEKEQRKWQDQWERTSEKTDKNNEQLKRYVGILDDLDSGTTQHTVKVHYIYSGFDPTKPGMKNP